MIKINLLAERKSVKAKASGARKEASSGLRNAVLVGLLLLGVGFSGGWWYLLTNDLADWRTKHQDADRELARLESVRQKGEEFERRKELLERKIKLITDLKKRQEVPVHILDQVSRNLPDFLWLESMSANDNNVSISGKATTYNAVSNFYTNLTQSGNFRDVSLGRTFEVPEGVAFSLSASFFVGDAPVVADGREQG
jgi:Tfp pilus assembly protein PilN